MKICSCGRIGQHELTNYCEGMRHEKLRVLPGTTPMEALKQEGEMHRAKYPETGWRAKRAAAVAEARKATKQ